MAQNGLNEKNANCLTISNNWPVIYNYFEQGWKKNGKRQSDEKKRFKSTF